MFVATYRELTPEFKEGNDTENLPLGIIRNGIPKSRRVGFTGERGSIHLHGPWEFEAVGMCDVTNEGEHSYTSVLDFSVTKETNGGFVALSPEFGVGEVQRIVESNNRVKLLGKNLKVGLSTKENIEK